AIEVTISAGAGACRVAHELVADWFGRLLDRGGGAVAGSLAAGQDGGQREHEGGGVRDSHSSTRPDHTPHHFQSAHWSERYSAPTSAAARIAGWSRPRARWSCDRCADSRFAGS